MVLEIWMLTRNQMVSYSVSFFTKSTLKVAAGKPNAHPFLSYISCLKLMIIQREIFTIISNDSLLIITDHHVSFTK
jgi:hypothetical protein